ncbi:MAG: hypothetical protein CMF22_10225 [Idiomarinaceae bacterium]|nr:hypothetical protein [Idiomarinaceae bacterium]MBG23818.1 hypothetical protein [Idiomarinaceae bacterium]|tara:strand:- start:36339 stop:36539 length:201 start_codon:yes stop_codon:yes gene_type:complete
MKIFEVIDDVYTVYVTRSESKAAQWWENVGKNGWITESEMDVYLGTDWHQQKIWEDLNAFKEAYGL